ncbi:MAG: bifunctional adenosylcobinamide kinase/adenosylcobinamide-phosphate guanylyltransferase [Candidatus Thiodiazotropha sp.]|jgi:adenosylcobinamide kinase / adenosylcobinamide-phosphate guanylyltransferase
MRTLILGGVRSGKSRLAEKLAIESNLSVTYIATAQAGDDEMVTRIIAHRERRPKQWQLIEEPYQLATVLEAHAKAGTCLLVECLTLWLTNLLLTPDPTLVEKERTALLSTLPNLPGQIILVGNETNMGIIPMDKLSRRFCDESGQLHQALAQISERVILTVAGLPQFLKGASSE